MSVTHLWMRLQFKFNEYKIGHRLGGAAGFLRLNLFKNFSAVYGSYRVIWNIHAVSNISAERINLSCLKQPITLIRIIKLKTCNFTLTGKPGSCKNNWICTFLLSNFCSLYSHMGRFPQDENLSSFLSL